MKEKKYDALRLENQLCFPLYVASREVIKRYTPFLEPLGLTYTQYIALMVLWETPQLNVKKLGQRLYLDSGTLTPLLKKMEQKGFVTRVRSDKDERNLIVTITDKGKSLREKCAGIPAEVRKQLNLTEEEQSSLYLMLYKLLQADEDE